MDERHVPVTLHSSPGDAERPPAVGYIADTPENRQALEAAAIPRCEEWRYANPELRQGPHPDKNDPQYIDPEKVSFPVTHFVPAPYCCSAYCDRCAGLRALNGDDEPLTPNEWMTK